ncbi:MAG: hypothetical protein HZB53_19105 [Chloroflexi bacterium]|nr:hypothetical protein [Chloroflexota bacterium]
MTFNEEDVRQVLTHLADYPYLGRHSLAGTTTRPGAEASSGYRARDLGLSVSTWLIGVLDEMSNESTHNDGSIESRYCELLRATYMDGATTTQIAEQWHASVRTVERWRRDALRVYTALLNEKIEDETHE